MSFAHLQCSSRRTGVLRRKSDYDGFQSKSQRRFTFLEASRLEPTSYLPYLYGFSCSADPCGCLLQAIRRESNSIESWILLGEQFAKKGDIPRSIKCFESAAQIFYGREKEVSPQAVGSDDQRAEASAHVSR